MTRVLHGIVHGKIIEVTEDLGMLDGQAVELIVTASPASGPCAEEIGSRKSPKKLPGPPPGWQRGSKRTAAGMLADSWTEEDDRILEDEADKMQILPIRCGDARGRSRALERPS
jgi:hypothetical protein